jgi:hypothetical protein
MQVPDADHSPLSLSLSLYIYIYIYTSLRKREAIHSYPLYLHGVHKDNFLPYLRFSLGLKTGEGFPSFFFFSPAL